MRRFGRWVYGFVSLKHRLKHPTVWFNAWNHQNTEELWAGLAHGIISQLSSRFHIRDRILFWLRIQKNRLDADRVLNGLAALVIEQAIPIAVTVWAAIHLFSFVRSNPLPTSTTAALVILGTLPVLFALRAVVSEIAKSSYAQFIRNPDYRAHVGSLAITQDDVTFSLSRLVHDDHPAIVFLDDLDRCFPSHVTEVIGAINLFLANNHRSCIFVLGMDTEVVAASIEVAHEKVIGKVSRHDGELGWNYMDKIVQLPIALPGILATDQENYFRTLLGESRGDENAGSRPYQRPPTLAGLTRDIAALQPHLSFNPRTLVKIANLSRFYLLLQAERHRVGSLAANEKQILTWSIVLARWPHFVRWLQRLQQSVKDSDLNSPSVRGKRKESAAALERLIERARMTNNADAWTTELDTDGIDHGGWALSPGLWELLHDPNSAPDLLQASEYGFW